MAATSLEHLGANPKLVVDGISGPDTIQAAKTFQTKAKLAADGKVGPMTKAAHQTSLGK